MPAVVSSRCVYLTVFAVYSSISLVCFYSFPSAVQLYSCILADGWGLQNLCRHLHPLLVSRPCVHHISALSVQIDARVEGIAFLDDILPFSFGACSHGVGLSDVAVIFPYLYNCARFPLKDSLSRSLQYLTTYSYRLDHGHHLYLPVCTSPQSLLQHQPTPLPAPPLPHDTTELSTLHAPLTLTQQHPPAPLSIPAPLHVPPSRARRQLAARLAERKRQALLAAQEADDLEADELEVAHYNDDDDDEAQAADDEKEVAGEKREETGAKVKESSSRGSGVWPGGRGRREREGGKRGPARFSGMFISGSGDSDEEEGG